MSIDPLQAQPVEVYKHDARSRVWRADLPAERGGAVVIKRFEYGPVRQAMAAMLGRHPLQRERRRHVWLAKRGVRVVPVTDSGWQGSLPGCRGWLATPYKGLSLHWLLCYEAPPWAKRRAVARSVADLLGQLIDAGLFNRDMKVSNIVVDEEQRAWLIDAGGVRRTAGAAAIWRMLAVLDETARFAGATRTDRLAVVRALVQAWPRLGTVREMLARMRG